MTGPIPHPDDFCGLDADFCLGRQSGRKDVEPRKARTKVTWTDHEWAVARLRAERAGMPLSEYIRRATLGALEEK